jgi:hypothetical protein
MQFELLGQTIKYSIDLSQVGCSCNAALFWNAMPGYGSDGKLSRGDYNNYYCDSNKVGGTWCWEMDTIEGNKHTMNVTPHECSGPSGYYIKSCDRSGCGTSSFLKDRKGLCPGKDKGCKIDSLKPFTHS